VKGVLGGWGNALSEWGCYGLLSTGAGKSDWGAEHP